VKQFNFHKRGADGNIFGKGTEMNPLKKTLLAFSMITVMITLFACTTIETTDDPQLTQETAAEISDFDLPPGYEPEFSTKMLGYTLVTYKGESDPSHLYLIQSEKESDGEELAKMLAQLSPGSSDPNTRMTVVENRPATVLGQEVTLIISEGVNSENLSYRQISVAFEGKGGPALLLFSETIENWDQAAVDEFLASIR
jgi:hypothetical protein